MEDGSRVFGSSTRAEAAQDRSEWKVEQCMQSEDEGFKEVVCVGIGK